MRKTAVGGHYSCIMQKRAPQKTANIRKMRPF